MGRPWARVRQWTGALSVRLAGRRLRHEASYSIPVISPRDGSVLGDVPDMTAAEVDAKVRCGAACARSEWADPARVGERSAALRRVAARLRAQREDLARMETVDCGKTLAESLADVDMSADLFDYYSSRAGAVMAPARVAVPDPAFESWVHAHPVGLVACVTPWNYPLLQAVVKVAPALAAGCATLIKPSPLAPLSCLQLEATCQEADLPEGAVAVVTGGPPGGRADGAARLAAHPEVAALSFTGSARGGRAMLLACAARLRPAALELGGKGAAVVFDDADLEAAAEWVMLGIFANAGQVCSATSRLLVHRPIHRRFTDALAARAEALAVGDPLAEGTQVGAVVSQHQLHRVMDFVDEAASEGAVVAAGGARVRPPGLEGGFYFKPTVLTGVGGGARAWNEEIFGPVLCVRPFDSEEEAVALANASPYGLAHAVLSADPERCARVSARLDAGSVWVNCSQVVFPSTPFGGWKGSGFGREYGEAGMHEYLRFKTVTGCASGYSWGYFGVGAGAEPGPASAEAPAKDGG